MELKILFLLIFELICLNSFAQVEKFSAKIIDNNSKTFIISDIVYTSEHTSFIFRLNDTSIKVPFKSIKSISMLKSCLEDNSNGFSRFEVLLKNGKSEIMELYCGGFHEMSGKIENKEFALSFHKIKYLEFL